MEGHFGKDGRFYICDTARFFPPEKRTSKIPGDIFYRLFRPEFLLYYKKTLSSDSYIPAFCSEKDIDDIEGIYNRLVFF